MNTSETMTPDATLGIAADFALPLDLVTEATAIVATRGAGKSSASAVIVEEAFALGVQAVVFDRTGVYWGLRSNPAGDGPGLGIYVLGGPHGDIPLEPTAGRLIADLVVDSGHSFVLDLSDMTKAAAVGFAAAFLERLYDRKARARTTTLLVIDEAHFYAPQAPRGGFKGASSTLMGAMEDVVGLGRSRGIGVVLTTQRTQALNKAILDLIETLIVMRMLSPRARGAVRAWIQEKHEEDELGVIPSLDSLPTGSAWVWSPLRGILERVSVRRIRTFDSYATPKPGQTRLEPTVRAELDLDALGEEMRATAERAAADDPARLRRRIADLERQLASRPEPEQLVVEVPAVQQEDVDRLGDLVAQLRSVADTLQARSSEVPAALEPLVDALNRTRPPTASETPSRPLRAPLTPTGHPTRPPARPNDSAAQNGSHSVVLSRYARGLLETLAQREPLPLTRSQVALFAGRSPKSSAFDAALSEIVRDGWASRDPQGTFQLTDAGRDAVGHVAPVATSAADVIAVWRDALPDYARDLLDALVQAHPDGLSREELSERTGRSARSSSFDGSISTLRRVGLAEVVGGEVRATDALLAGRV